MTEKRSKSEDLKERSHFLRGTIAEELQRSATGAIVEEDTQLLKFHGSYMQDDRDLRAERTKKKLEKAYIFMVRLRIPGGVLDAAQWQAIDRIATDYANGTMRITTRATFQLHGIIKSNMKRALQAINAAGLNTIAACGDVNRGVMSVANPYLSRAHREAYDTALKVNADLLPRTGAYSEIWLDGAPAPDQSPPLQPESEPLYGPTYLPRKFKVVFAVPPDNDVDVFAHDLGFIAIVEDGRIVGWNVSVGGGMGMTHGEPNTFPRTGDVIGFCKPDDVVAVSEHVVGVQRDWGNRVDRKQARLKYTLEVHGVAAFRAEVEKRLGFKLGEARPYTFRTTGDVIGWRQSEPATGGRGKGAGKPEARKWHLTLYVESGRIKDRPGMALRTALREIAALGDVGFVLTGNQNVIITNVAAKARSKVEAILASHGIEIPTSSGLRRNSIACVALPTCALALAESERFMPELLTALEGSLDKAGLRDDDIVIRMTGCPNGCGRPYLAEIGLVGRAPGLYNLYLGAAFDGTRMNKLYAQDVGKARIVELVEPLFLRYAKERKEGERFGDFVIRAGVVKPTLSGNTFHDDVTLVS
jgi:sulfite reductase (NADPH) hemoprotein beta-component